MIVSLEDGQIEGTLKRKGHMQKDFLFRQSLLRPLTGVTKSTL